MSLVNWNGGASQSSSTQRPSGVSSANADTGTEASNTAASALLGDTIAEVDEQSVFADAMDELSASLSERTQEKKLRERKLSDAEESLALLREHLKAMLTAFASEQSGEKPAHIHDEEIRELARKIFRDPGLTRQLVGEYTDNPTEQYLVLREIDERIEARELNVPASGPARMAIRETAAEIFAEHSHRILADINTFSATAELQQAQAQSVRSTYRDAVLGEATLAATVAQLLNATDGGSPEDFLRVHQSMVRALGLDLAASHSSVDKVKLQALASDLFQLSTIATTVERCQTLSAQLARRHGLEAVPGTRIATELLNITGERWADSARFARLAERFQFNQPDACAIEFLQASRSIMSGMPVQVFQSAEARTALLESVQTAIDQAVAREDAALG